MGCGCKKRRHPIVQQPTPSTIRLPQPVQQPQTKPISEEENKIIQQIVEELQKLNNQ